jgi:hypothetical protein
VCKPLLFTRTYHSIKTSGGGPWAGLHTPGKAWGWFVHPCPLGTGNPYSRVGWLVSCALSLVAWSLQVLDARVASGVREIVVRLVRVRRQGFR